MIDAQAKLAAIRVRRRGLGIPERRLLLATLDLVAVGTAFLIAFNLRTAQVRDEVLQVPRIALGITLLAWLVAAQIAGAYDLRITASARATARALAAALAICSVELLVVFFVAPYRITRPTLLLWIPLAAILVMGSRFLHRAAFARGLLAGHVAMVMGRDAAARVQADAGTQLRDLYRVVAIIDPADPELGDRVHALAQTGRIDQLILGVRDDISRDLFRSLLRCHESGVTVRSVADLYEELTGRLLLDQLGHSWLLALPMRAETSRLYTLFKRIVDITSAIVALVALALLLPLVAAMMFACDRGPLFHSQIRVGKYGREFRLWKIRSMQVAGDREKSWTAASDARITPVGRLLRRLHLDELPQAWSILRGDMSLVGPRPEQPHYVEQLGREIDFYRTRLTVRPGLTGWAQVNYGYGGGVEGARAKLSFDLYYIKRQSAALDCLIVGRTVMAVLSLGGR